MGGRSSLESPYNNQDYHSNGVGDTAGDENTILIKRTLRSGQRLRYDGNVVVMGDVNPGAEIVASGNIIVMGQLRGVVHAGATGNEKAIVMSFRLAPTQLRIANHITRPPDGDNTDSDRPEIASIKNGVVTIELFNASADRQHR
jgi:septum site-determining protein MinC